MLENTDTPQEIEAITEEIDRFQRYIDEYLPGVVAFGLRVLMALLVFFIGSRLIKLLRRIVRRSMFRSGVHSETGGYEHHQYKVQQCL